MCTRTRARTHTHPPTSDFAFSPIRNWLSTLYPLSVSVKDQVWPVFPMIRGSTASRYLPRGH
uniref:Uncharacterized protein n=1 Tax=Anguilla anguilla TaxID=7936 RepID=A0A0E9RFS4_ANGAN